MSRPSPLVACVVVAAAGVVAAACSSRTLGLVGHADAGDAASSSIAGAGAAGSGVGAAGATGSAGDVGAGAAGNGMPPGGTAGAPDDAGVVPEAAVAPAPGAFTMTSPLGDPEASSSPTLTWTAAGGATEYQVELSTTSAFEAATTVRYDGLTKTSTYPTKGLPPGLLYFWRVTAVGPGGRTAASNGPAWFSTPVDVPPVPYGVAVTPQGKAIVTHRDTPPGVTVVDLTTGTTKFVSTPGGLPYLVSATADGSKAFVSLWSPKRVAVVDVEAGTATDLPKTRDGEGSYYYGLAATPDGSFLVAPVLDSARSETVLDIVPLSGAAAIRSVGLGIQQVPYGVGMTPDGATALATVNGITRVELATGAVKNIKTTAYAVAVTADSKTAWFTEGEDGGVRSLDLQTNTLGPRLAFTPGHDFCGIAVTPDGKRAVVTAATMLGVLDLAAGKIEKTYPIPSRCVTTSADGRRAYFTGFSPKRQLFTIALP